jgi:RNA polymerase sigma-70 factor (ECF subfamily)
MSGFESSQHDTVGFSEKLTKARNGSSDEQAAMLETFRDYLRKIASKTISDNAQAQLSVSDLVQSAIIDAHKSFASCRATNSVEFKAWIRQILLNDILNRNRNLRRQKRDIRKEKQLSGRYLVEDIDSPSEQVIRQEDEQRLESAVMKLNPEFRQVIRMRHQKNMTFVDIGKAMDRTPDSTRMLWNRAIKALSQILADR